MNGVLLQSHLIVPGLDFALPVGGLKHNTTEHYNLPTVNCKKLGMLK